jgi:ATP-dependent Clp protease ATP-binding subunit ClpC
MCLPPRSSRRYSRMLELSRQEAAALGAPAVGTAHLLLGLAREDRERGAGLLAAVDPDALRRVLPSVPGPSSGPPPLSVRAGVVVGAAQRRAARRGVSDLEVEDVLAAVLGDPDSAAVAALERLGVDVGDLWCRAVTELDRDQAPGDRSPRARVRDARPAHAGYVPVRTGVLAAGARPHRRQRPR